MNTPSQKSLNQRFGRLIVTQLIYRPHKNKPTQKIPFAKCICDCGKTKTVLLRSLKSGDTKSCGCLNKQRQKEKKIYRRKNKIYFVDLKDFAEVVKNSVCFYQVARHFQIQANGNTILAILTRAKENNIDFSHFRRGRRSRKGIPTNQSPPNKIETEKWLLKKTHRKMHTDIKIRLLTEKLLNNVCYICGLKNSWNNKPLVLQLDHINGDAWDNRLSNLRMLCPNCHSQAPTTGRSKHSKQMITEEYKDI